MANFSFQHFKYSLLVVSGLHVLDETSPDNFTRESLSTIVSFAFHLLHSKLYLNLRNLFNTFQSWHFFVILAVHRATLISIFMPHLRFFYLNNLSVSLPLSLSVSLSAENNYNIYWSFDGISWGSWALFTFFPFFIDWEIPNDHYFKFDDYFSSVSELYKSAVQYNVLMMSQTTNNLVLLFLF